MAMYSNEETEELYDSRYSKKSKGWVVRREEQKYKIYRKLLLNWSEAQYQDKTCLDLGCGTGVKTTVFSKGFKKVVAIDLSANSIALCSERYAESQIEWVKGDAMQVQGTFDVITAFGFSLFNTPDNEEFLSGVGHFITHNLSGEKGVMLVGSFTDGSGSGESWYMHSPADLNYITQELEKRHGVKTEVIFPHRYRSNYFGNGLMHPLLEIKHLLTGRRRNFFIKIVYG